MSSQNLLCVVASTSYWAGQSGCLPSFMQCDREEISLVGASAPDTLLSIYPLHIPQLYSSITDAA